MSNEQYRLKGAVPSVTLPEQLAWLWALTLFVVSDMALTAIGLDVGAVENNPVVLQGIEQIGLWPAMIGMKALVLAWVWVCWRLSPDRYRILFPAVLAVMGAVIAGINSYVVLVTAGVL